MTSTKTKKSKNRVKALGSEFKAAMDKEGTDLSMLTVEETAALMRKWLDKFLEPEITTQMKGGE